MNRGAAYADGKIFYNLLDGHTVAVDAATGKQLWRTQMADVDRGETITMAPIVVKGKVLVGSSGGEMGVAAGSRRSTPRPARKSGAATTRAAIAT